MTSDDGGDCPVPWCQRHEVTHGQQLHVWEQRIGDSGASVAVYLHADGTRIWTDLPEAFDVITAREASAALLAAADLAELWQSPHD